MDSEHLKLVLEEARALGLSGDGLKEYLSQEKERIRQDRKEKEEREDKRQRDERALAREHEKAKLEYEKEIQLAKINLEREKVQANAGKEDSQSRSQNRSGGNFGRFPKLPKFDEDKDEIDAYLFRFETYAKNMQFVESDWAFQLSTHLGKNALSVYSAIAASPGSNYQVLKKALLDKFQCSKDGFREKFRACKPDLNESFVAYASRVNHLFDRWIDLSGIDHTFEGLKDLLLCEHVLAAVNRDLSVFLRERNLTKSKDMFEAAENYRLAHPNKSMARSNKFELGMVGATSSSEWSGGVVSSQIGRGGRFVPKQHQFGQRQFGSGFGRGRGRGRGSGQGFNSVGQGNSGGQNFKFRNKPGDSSHGLANAGGGSLNTPSTQVVSKQQGEDNRCFFCGQLGHIQRGCLEFLKSKKKGGTSAGFKVGCVSVSAAESVTEGVLCSAMHHVPEALPICTGVVNGFQVSVLRDSGATTAGVRKALVREDQFLHTSQDVVSFGGRRETFPLAMVEVQTPYFSGKLSCCVIDEPVADLILGNIQGVSPIPGLLMGDSVHVAAAVQTRAQVKAEKEGTARLKVPVADLEVSRDELMALQHKDKTLQDFWDLSVSRSKKVIGKAEVFFSQADGVLCRHFQKDDTAVVQVVVPSELRSKVLFMAHDGLLSGHCGVRRTLGRTLLRFWWPGVRMDVTRYCRTCEVCQKCAAKGKTPDVPLSKMPRIDEPFQRVAVDIVGPFSPPSEEKHRYVLTIVDTATRYPEAVPLKSIDSRSVAEALLDVFCRLGFPSEILSDNGSQFTSDMFQEFVRLFSIKHVRSSPYHAQSNGVVERFHGTFKPMLKKVIQENPRQWHRRIPPLLFACRELPSVSTGFSPFELLFGRPARGPIDFLADAWLERENVGEAKGVCQFVLDVRNSVSDMCRLAQDNVERSGKVNKMYKDRRSKHRSFSVGDEVLVFLPTAKNKLQMVWDGPYKVVKVLKFDYVVEVRGKSRIFHPNLLKKFHRRQGAVAVTQVSGPTIPFLDILPISFHQEEVSG